MKKEWEEINLGEICFSICRGITPIYQDDGFIVLNQKCIRKNVVDFNLSRKTYPKSNLTANKTVEEGDILINSTGAGTLGRTAYVTSLPKNMVTADSHVTIVKTNNNVNSKFLGYYLNLCEPIIENMGKGSTNQLELSRSDLSRMKIKLPPLETQNIIAKILSNYDDLIENNLKRIKILEEMAQITFEEWFLRMKYPGHENDKIIEETGLPEGWKLDCISKIINFDSGFAFKSKDFKDNGNPIIKIKNINNNTIDIINTDFVDEKIQIRNKFKIERNDLLIAMTGNTIGKVGIMPKVDRTYFLNQRVGRFLQKGNVDNRGFINCLFSSEIGNRLIVNFANGAGQANISSSDILAIKTVIPSFELQKQFSKFCNPIINLKSQLFYQNQKLNESKDILLPRLMTGMIDVNELEGVEL